MQLISIVLNLKARTRLELPLHGGRANYALVLDQVERVDKGLASWLHEGSGAKPLTCSSLRTASTGGSGGVLSVGETAYVRVTGLSEAVSGALHAALIEETPVEWAIRRAPLQVEGATMDASVDRWAGAADYAQLLAQATREVAGTWDQRLRFTLAAPTAFRSAGLTIPLPLPGLLFGSLLDRWNAYSPAALDKDIRSVAQSAVGISYFRLESVATAPKDGALLVGSIGDVTYEYMGSDPYWLGQLRALAAFAKFSGVGLKTTMGLGQCLWRQ